MKTEKTSGKERRSLETVVTEVERWAEPVEGKALLDEIEQLLRQHVVLPEGAAETLALWVVHTYAFELRDVGTYIGLESPEKRCGKTTLLGLLSRLVHPQRAGWRGFRAGVRRR